ncbi:MAG: hypothetical protein K8S87_08645 [Planctomycetes bacterium]|nr:hypothetical protein [Planctomycetota bacterium]
MSVAGINRFWDKRSLIFKVLIVVIIMVPLGVYNLVGASMFGNNTTEIKILDANNAEKDYIENTDFFRSEILNPKTDVALISVDADYFND